ncbi:hypothetical protein ABZZ79_01445 [Streptomyces sp. NPDC006458]|uniref:hypothetical protein n=1 Tax=Streptomyces sp. NPDC006458 TaxID=3154302 RepID=UPI0033B7C935
MIPAPSKRPAEPAAECARVCSAESAYAQTPLTSEPPLPYTEPLTSEPPLAAPDADTTRP